MTRPSTEEEGPSPPSRARKAEWQYIVRSLELATRAFQDSLLSRAAKPSHDWHVQPVVKDQNRIPPERCVSVELPTAKTIGCPRNLGISYGRARRVETNLSNLPQLFTMCQPSNELISLSRLIPDKPRSSEASKLRSKDSLLRGLRI